MPTAIAGIVEPATSSGFLSMKPIMIAASKARTTTRWKERSSAFASGLGEKTTGLGRKKNQKRSRGFI
jgi:hypothetical protein